MSTQNANANIDPKLIENMPAALLKELPAASPPPGLQPNFSDPPTQVPTILGVGIAFLTLAFLCFSIRIYTKVALVKRWKWDDLTCFLGFMGSIVYFVGIVMGCVDGAAGRHEWDVPLEKAISRSQAHQAYITTVVVTPALGLIKSSLFIQYYLLFRPLRWIRVCVWTGATISTLFYVAVTVTAFALESPWPRETFLEDILSEHYAKFQKFSVPTGVIGTLVDWYLLILPIPAVLGLQISMARKVGILIIFMTGALAAAASAVSLYYRVLFQNFPADATWKVGYIFVWVQIEMFAGVAASSMPTIHQFFVHRNFRPTSWRPTWRYGRTYIMNGSTKMKLSDYTPSFRSWGKNSMQASNNREHFRMNDLESNSCECKAAKPPSVADSRVRLTRDVSVIHEPLDTYRPF